MAKKPISKGITVLQRTKDLFGAGHSEEVFEARVEYRGNNKNAKLHSLYVGVYFTLDKAILARQTFILGLV